MKAFVARFRRVSDGQEVDRPITGADSLEEAWLIARASAARLPFAVEVVNVFPVTVRVIEIELPPEPEPGDLYWPSIPGGIIDSAAHLYFMLCLHRYHH